VIPSIMGMKYSVGLALLVGLLVLLGVAILRSPEADADIADVKMIAGVPVLNYHRRHYTSGAQAGRILRGNGAGRDRQRGGRNGTTDWVLSLNRSGVDDEWTNKVCHANGTCLASGHPSHGGPAFAVVRATDAELESVLTSYGDGIAFAEPDAAMYAVPESDRNLTEQALSILNSGLSWGLDRIDDRAGLDGSYDVATDGGRGVHVYVADTGIRTTHDDFAGADGVSRAIPTLEVLGAGVVECDPADVNCARDRDGHGTHCAGTIAGTRHGVAKGVTVHAVKVLGDDGSGSFSWFVEALDWVVANGQRPAVFSASLGGPGSIGFVSAAIQSATDAGVIVVVAAGNENDDACSYSPASATAAVTVGATTSSDGRAWYSNYGSCLDIFAPGSQITSAGHESNSALATLSGTSMATPHVAGAAALLLQNAPSSSAVQIISELKRLATSEIIDQVAEGSPNLLLYVGQEDPSVTVTTTTTTCMSSGMWSVCSGPCQLDADGCVYSPNYPSGYANEQSCDIRVNPSQEASPIVVEAFHTEANYDLLVVNGVSYSGNLGSQGGPHGVIPSGAIQWSSDYSIVKTGWKLCADSPVTTVVATTATTTSTTEAVATSSTTTTTSAVATSAPVSSSTSTATTIEIATTTTSTTSTSSTSTTRITSTTVSTTTTSSLTSTLSTTTLDTTSTTMLTTTTLSTTLVASTSTTVTTTTSTLSVTLSHALSTTVSTFMPDRLFDFLDVNKDGAIDMNEWHRLR